MVRANLSQREPEWLRFWEELDIYRRSLEANEAGPVFVLHDGPPYANGHIHMGTAYNKVLKDLIVKYRNLKGEVADYIPGWDCHGLPIELKVDRDLGVKKREMSPLAFRQACRAYAEKYVAIQRDEFERLGVLGEWQDPYLTMAPSYQATILRELAVFVEKGLVYKAKKSVHWCISCRTALAEAEVEYDEHHVSPSIDVPFPLAEADRDRLARRFPALADRQVAAVIWTTTPWTLPGNQALNVHPDFDYALVETERGLLIVADAMLAAGDIPEATEEEFDSLALGSEGLRAVTPVHRAIQSGVGFRQLGRHSKRIVEVGQCCATGQVFFAHVQHRLRRHLHRRALLFAWRLRPRIVIVDHAARVAVI